MRGDEGRALRLAEALGRYPTPAEWAVLNQCRTMPERAWRREDLARHAARRPGIGYWAAQVAVGRLAKLGLIERVPTPPSGKRGRYRSKEAAPCPTE